MGNGHGHWGTMNHEPQEPADFIIERLARLVVVLFEEHVGNDPAALKARADSRAILVALGNWAAKQGRADLMPILHGLAAKIEGLADPSTSNPDSAPRFYERPRMTVRRPSYRW